MIHLVQRAGIATVVVLHVVASRRVPARYRLVEHLRLIEVLLMVLGCAVRVHRADMAARAAADIGGVIELLLLLLLWWALMANFRRALRAVFVRLVTVLLLLLLLLLLPGVHMILLFIVHCCVLKFNMSLSSCRHIPLEIGTGANV